MTDVLIPTYKPGAGFHKIIDSLKKQTVKPDRLIVINTGKEYWDKDMAGILTEDDQNFIDLHHISEEEFDHGHTRNVAAGYSDADIMIFMTQDALPADEHFIEELIKPFEDPEIAVSYARQLPAEGCSLVEQITRRFNYPDRSVVKNRSDRDRLGIKTYFCSNVACAYRRSVFDEIGGFTDRTIFNEDMIYAAAVAEVGYSISYTADAKVYHSHNYTAGQQFRRNVDIGISQADHPEVFSGLSSESEGKKLVMTVIKELASSGKILKIPGYVWMIICRYAGFKIGRNYKKLPMGFVKKCSMNPGYLK